MDGILVVLGVVVVPALVGGLAVALVGRARARAASPSAGERDAAVRAAIDHLVQVNEQVRAGERRAGAHELAGAKALIDRELGQMRGDLHRLHALVEEMERERHRSAGELATQLAETGRSTQALADSTRTLREALASSTTRGQWGERMADDVLRSAGFVDGVNYVRHRRIPGAGGVPDYTFVLPQGLVLHMEVKFPLDNFLKHLEAPSGVERERHRREFLKDVRLRLREVTTRGYASSDDTVDCVLLFIPNEQVYGFIQQEDRALMDDALRENVVLCSPLTLFAVLAVIRRAVESFRLSESAHEVVELLQGFHAQWERFVEQMDKVGRGIRAVGSAFDELEGPRRRQLERQLDRIDRVHPVEDTSSLDAVH